MNKKLIGSLLALTLVGGVVTTSHAQAATVHGIAAQHDAYTAHAGPSAPSPSEISYWRQIAAAAAKVAGAVTDLWDAVAGGGGSVQARLSVDAGERIFDTPQMR